MKKLITISLMLSVLFTLFLTSCKTDADKDELPGKWTKNAELWSLQNVPNVTTDDYTVHFKMDKPKDEWGLTLEKGYFDFGWSTLTKEYIFTGFEATSTASSKSGCGYIFNFTARDNPDYNPDDSSSGPARLWSYYMILISNGYFQVREYVDNKYTFLTGNNNNFNWESFTDLNIEPNSNKTTVYTDTDGSIIIKFNGSLAKTIRNPVNKKGEVGFVYCCSDVDQEANTTIKTDFKFTSFQY